MRVDEQPPPAAPDGRLDSYLIDVFGLQVAELYFFCGRVLGTEQQVEWRWNQCRMKVVTASERTAALSQFLADEVRPRAESGKANVTAVFR
jgi:hypothetical protein